MASPPLLSNDSFKGKVAYITGASRGIGREIALKLARAGVSIAIVAKTSTPDPKLPGTIFSVAQEIEQFGGKALPLACDIRYENQVEATIRKTVETFGGIDILVNNASAIWLKGTEETNMKRFDLMLGINVRGTYCCSRLCIPYLRESARKGRNPHILNISPPLNMNPKWFKNNVAYTISKYGMSLCVLGMAEEFKSDGIAVNALWPRTGISTLAISFIAGNEMLNACRLPSIMADAAFCILSLKSDTTTGNFFIDEKILTTIGGMRKEQLDQYAVKPGTPLMLDFFLEEKGEDSRKPKL